MAAYEGGAARSAHMRRAPHSSRHAGSRASRVRPKALVAQKQSWETKWANHYSKSSTETERSPPRNRVCSIVTGPAHRATQAGRTWAPAGLGRQGPRSGAAPAHQCRWRCAGAGPSCRVPQGKPGPPPTSVLKPNDAKKGAPPAKIAGAGRPAAAPPLPPPPLVGAAAACPAATHSRGSSRSSDCLSSSSCSGSASCESTTLESNCCWPCCAGTCGSRWNRSSR